VRQTPIHFALSLSPSRFLDYDHCHPQEGLEGRTCSLPLAAKRRNRLRWEEAAFVEKIRLPGRRAEH
jgi:hypothetical protein